MQPTTNYSETDLAYTLGLIAGESSFFITFKDTDEKRPLQRDQFETLYRRVADEPGGFELDRLPADADPCPTVLSLHPEFEIDEDAGVITKTDGPISTQLLDTDPDPENAKNDRSRTWTCMRTHCCL
ncbi:MAG: hypothetical protein J07HQX50_02669 [Haloquadratum sp. J07HQX50]|nr:MAG: hypothetical protein J07HQX50_02669 [Haloquadratum sp. J07HQX50]